MQSSQECRSSSQICRSLSQFCLYIVPYLSFNFPNLSFDNGVSDRKQIGYTEPIIFNIHLIKIAKANACYFLEKINI